MNVVAREVGAPRSWYHHKLSDYPIILADAKIERNCIGFWQPKSGWKLIEMSNRFSSEGPYEYLPLRADIGYGDDDNKAARDETIQLLQSHQLPFALLWLWGTWEPDLSNPQLAEYRAKALSKEASGLETAIHEAFHFFVQHPGNQRSWTNFRGRARDEDLQACYVGTPEIKKIHRAEVKALMDAFVAQDRAQSISNIQRFLELRAQRYSLKPTITFKDWNGEEFTGSCKEEEARQELGEGVPQFTGNALILDLGLGTRKQIADEILMTTNYYLDTPLAEGQRPIQSYYHMGSVSLLLVRQFYRGNFLDLTREISQPESQVIVTDLLAETIQEAGR